MKCFAPRYLLLLVLLPQCCAADEDLQPLLDTLDRIRERHGVAAFGFTLVSPGARLYAGAHGIADRSSAAPATSTTRFRLGSITKMFTALAILRAAEDGRISLDQPFRDLAGAGQIDNPWAACAPVTIAQLLEHTSGLTDLSHTEMYHSDPTPLPLGRAVREFADQRRVQWRPGMYYAYSNAGPGLAAWATELATGEEFDAYLTRVVLKPLGMDDSSLRRDAATADTLATGYDRDGVTPIPYWHMLFRPFGALNTTPGDMVPLLQMLLNGGAAAGGRVLSTGSLQRMEQPTTSFAARHGLKTGYGLGVYRWYHDGHRFYGHGGDGDGYLAHLGYSHTARRGYLLVINAFNHQPLRAMRRAVEDHITRHAPALPPEPPEPDRRAQSWPPDGDYRAAAWRFPGTRDQRGVVHLRRHDSGLEIRGDGTQTRSLIPAGGSLWRAPTVPDASAFITPDPAGRWLLLRARSAHLGPPAEITPYAETPCRPAGD